MHHWIIGGHVGMISFNTFSRVFFTENVNKSTNLSIV